MGCDSMLFGGQAPAFQKNISTHLPASRVKNPRKPKYGSSQPRKPQTVQTLLTAASRGISDNAVIDSFTW